MATSSTFSQIWSGVQLEYKDSERTAQRPTPIVHRPSKPQSYPQRYKWQIVWRNVVAFLVLHAAAVYGFYLIIFGHVQIKTQLFSKYKFRIKLITVFESDLKTYIFYSFQSNLYVNTYIQLCEIDRKNTQKFWSEFNRKNNVINFEISSDFFFFFCKFTEKSIFF